MSQLRGGIPTRRTPRNCEDRREGVQKKRRRSIPRRLTAHRGGLALHAAQNLIRIMTISGKAVETFTARFIDEGSKVLLELTNESNQTLKVVEILTVFLKDEETPGGPSRVHISFKALNSIRSNEKAIITHKTWIDGKPAGPEQDQLERLKAAAGEARPYVLDISWQDAEGKTQYQRIPVGR